MWVFFCIAAADFLSIVRLVDVGILFTCSIFEKYTYIVSEGLSINLLNAVYFVKSHHFTFSLLPLMFA